MKHFENLPGGPKANINMFQWAAFIWRRLRDKAPEIPADHIIPQESVVEALQALTAKDTLTWLGHNTFILHINGKTILTDPFLSDFASPIKSLSPVRFAPPGLTVEQLPKVDVIIVTHDHYDHFDLNTIRLIPHKEDIHVVVPLKLCHMCLFHQGPWFIAAYI